MNSPTFKINHLDNRAFKASFCAGRFMFFFGIENKAQKDGNKF